MNPTATDDPRSSSRTSRAYFLIPIAFIAAYFVARWGIKKVEPGSTAALVFALLPLPAFAVLLWAFIRGVRSLDELQRRIQLEALAFAFPIAMFVVFTAGLLDLAGFHGEGNWDLPRLMPILLLPYWFGIMLGHRRYA